MLAGMSTLTLEDAQQNYIERISKAWKYTPEQIAQYQQRLAQIEQELERRTK